MRTVFVVLFLFFLSGCSVDTDSSAHSTGSTSGGTDTGTDTGTDGETDTNSTDGSVEVIVDNSDAGFDKTDAVEDENACIINDTYQVIADSSFDPLSTADVDNGVEVSSMLDYTTDLDATKVALFFPELTQEKIGKMVNVYEDLYRIAYDQAWVNNDDASIYVRTPQNVSGNYMCYRYDLDSLDGTSITKTKVYR